MRAAWRPVGNYRVRLLPPPSRSHRPPLLSQGHCRGVVLPCCGSYQRQTSNNSFTVWRESLCKLQNQMKLHYLFVTWTMRNGDLFLTVITLFQMCYCLSWVSWVNTLIRFRYIASIIIKFTKHKKIDPLKFVTNLFSLKCCMPKVCFIQGDSQKADEL